MKNVLELQILEKVIMAVVISSGHVFEETLWAEIITSDLELFDFLQPVVVGIRPNSSLFSLSLRAVKEGGSPCPGVVLLSREAC